MSSHASVNAQLRSSAIYLLVVLFYHCYAGDLLMLLNVSSDQKILSTTFGELRPPLGKHRLKVDLIFLFSFWQEMILELT